MPTNILPSPTLTAFTGTVERTSITGSACVLSFDLTSTAVPVQEIRNSPERNRTFHKRVRVLSFSAY